MTSGRKIKLDEVRKDEQHCQPDKTYNQNALEVVDKIGQNQTDNVNAQNRTRRSSRGRATVSTR